MRDITGPIDIPKISGCEIYNEIVTNTSLQLLNSDAVWVQLNGEMNRQAVKAGLPPGFQLEPTFLALPSRPQNSNGLIDTYDPRLREHELTFFGPTLFWSAIWENPENGKRDRKSLVASLILGAEVLTSEDSLVLYHDPVAKKLIIPSQQNKQKPENRCLPLTDPLVSVLREEAFHDYLAIEDNFFLDCADNGIDLAIGPHGVIIQKDF